MQCNIIAGLKMSSIVEILELKESRTIEQDAIPIYRGTSTEMYVMQLKDHEEIGTQRCVIKQ